MCSVEQGLAPRQQSTGCRGWSLGSPNTLLQRHHIMTHTVWLSLVCHATTLFSNVFGARWQTNSFDPPSNKRVRLHCACVVARHGSNQRSTSQRCDDGWPQVGATVYGMLLAAIIVKRCRRRMERNRSEEAIESVEGKTIHTYNGYV